MIQISNWLDATLSNDTIPPDMALEGHHRFQTLCQLEGIFLAVFLGHACATSVTTLLPSSFSSSPPLVTSLQVDSDSKVDCSYAFTK